MEEQALSDMSTAARIPRLLFHCGCCCRAFLLFTLGTLACCSVLAQDATKNLLRAAVSGPKVKAPPGSYQLSCVMIDMGATNLRAMCRTLKGDWLTTELHNPGRCGDIENIDGHLTCQSPVAGKDSPPEEKPFEESASGIDELLGIPFPIPPENWQLVHKVWTFKDGAPENVVALAQTSEGFLWLGGIDGLFRFDGKRFELFHSPFGEQFLSTNIYSLFAPPSGGLWIGYGFGGVSFLNNGRVKNYEAETSATGTIWEFAQDPGGNVWAAATSGLWRYDGSHWQHIGTEWNVPAQRALEVLLDREGNLWAHVDTMLLRLSRGSRRFQVVRKNLPTNTKLFSDNSRLMDKEGGLWFGGFAGLDRFFYNPLAKQDLSNGGGLFAVAAADNGGVWIGGSDTPLYRATLGKTEILPKYQSWNVQFIYRAPDGTIWLATDRGLWHETLSHQQPYKSRNEPLFDVRMELWRFTNRDWELFKLPNEVAGQELYLQAIAQDQKGGMWVSLGRHGLYRLADGVWTSYGGRKDLPTTGVLCEFTDRLGRVWFGYTKGQLAVLEDDRVRVFGPSDGIRVGNITAIYGRGSEIWIGGEFGLQHYDNGRFQSIAASDSEWLRGISGIVETANGDLWLSGLSGIFHMSRTEVAESLKSPDHRAHGQHFGRAGVPGFPAQLRPLPSAIEGSDGRLWFALSNGVVSLDPAFAEKTAVPPSIAIQSISADEKFHEPVFPMKLPAHTSDLRFSFAAVSLSDPEAIRYRYKLQEMDKDWHEVRSADLVTYRNLSPGSYHFIVGASDANGDWSEKVASAEFTILPAYYQTTWFRLLCLAAFLAFLWGLYQLRVRQVTQRVRAQMEGRVGERERIARDLHDTLLQSFQGVLLKFSAATYLIPNRPAEAQKTLESVIEQAREAITEGRDAVQGLRSSIVVSNNLARSITIFGEGLADDPSCQGSPDLQVRVEGTTRDLAPLVRDEVYRIVSESLRNAFRHAQAERIEVEIRYERRWLRVRIRDNGKGIDPKILAEGGRAGHHGLPGMKERAQLVGGKLAVWSELNAGTETELTIPASVAYSKPAAARRLKSSGKQ
jgi:signal transduction histidine kinase/ligand-binding sensor domain-containing protein